MSKRQGLKLVINAKREKERERESVQRNREQTTKQIQIIMHECVNPVEIG